MASNSQIDEIAAQLEATDFRSVDSRAADALLALLVDLRARFPLNVRPRLTVVRQ